MVITKEAANLFRNEPNRLIHVLAETDPSTAEYNNVLSNIARVYALAQNFNLSETVSAEQQKAIEEDGSIPPWEESEIPKTESTEYDSERPQTCLVDVRKALALLRKEKKISIPEFLMRHYQVDRLSDLPESQYSDCMVKVEEIRNAAN